MSTTSNSCFLRDDSWSFSGSGGNCFGSSRNDPSLCVETTSNTHHDFATYPVGSSQTLVLNRTGRYVLPPHAFLLVPNAGSTGATFGGAIESHPHVIVPNHAGHVVIDLHRITDAAYTDYTTASAPGGGLGLLPVSSWPVFTNLITTTSQYIPSPAFTVINKSSRTVYVTGGITTAMAVRPTFEGVSPTSGVRARESVTYRFFPNRKMWVIEGQSEL